MLLLNELFLPPIGKLFGLQTDVGTIRPQTDAFGENWRVLWEE